MPRYFLDASQNYYETTKDTVTPAGHTAVVQRPSVFHDYTGGAWVERATRAAEELEIEREGMVVSGFQAKEALAQQDLLTTAEDIVTAAGGTSLRAWNEAQEFRRNSPTIAALAVGLYPGQTADQIAANLDALFRAAALIEA